MSYLSTPRLSFNGYFQADVSTINNDVRFYDSEKFKPQYQMSSSTGVSPNGGWAPEGTGVFRLVGCRITGGWLDGAPVKLGEDPAIGLALEDSDQRVAGKLVDLDPQQQAVSEIWGMALRLTDDKNRAYLRGQYGVAAFINLWLRQQQASAPSDQQLAAVYQSVLEGVTWDDLGGSRLLEALRAATEDGLLSINFNAYAYGRDPSIPRYTLGRITGTIGPGRASEPCHFVLGRQLLAKMLPNGVSPAFGVYNLQCEVDAKRSTVTADFGNSLQITNASGDLADSGELSLAVLKLPQVDDGAEVNVADVAILGPVPYQEPDWYFTTAGVVTYDYSSDSWIRDNIAGQPLVVLKTLDDGNYRVVIQESLGGLYARADQYVYRLDPGQTENVRFYATRYGAPIAAQIAATVNNDGMGGAGTGQKIPDIPVPDIGVPASAIQYLSTVDVPADGRPGLLAVSAAPEGPGNPRGYIDGQLYGIGYSLSDPPLPANYNANDWNFISVLIFDRYEVPEVPTWYADIRPILVQYGNLYPIMSHHVVDLGDYDSVVRHANITRFAFALPVHDANSMPVTRDLSMARRLTILKWFDRPGPDGLPIKGEPVPAALTAAAPREETAPVELQLDPLQRAGKTEFLLQLQAKKKAEQGD
ncbi:MAG TPA: hypothetical protein VHU81_00615 [Thermoanaerobaculia bacterium]|nr:hypothetical protein [Thermoanaerobaculia bacterium]